MEEYAGQEEEDKETKSLAEEYLARGDDEDSEEKEIITPARIVMSREKENSRHQQINNPHTRADETNVGDLGELAAEQNDEHSWGCQAGVEAELR